LTTRVSVFIGKDKKGDTKAPKGKSMSTLDTRGSERKRSQPTECGPYLKQGKRELNSRRGKISESPR